VIEALFEERLGARVGGTRDLTVGCEQRVWKVETDLGDFVLKEPHRDPLINFREKFATDLCRANGVPAPKVVWCDETYLIEEFIDGEPLDQARLTSTERANVFRELGEVLGRMHRIPVKGYGPLTSDGSGESDDYLSFYTEKGKAEESKERRAKAKEYFRLHKRFLQDRKPVLIHFDMEEEHVLIKDGRIVGLVDFATAFAGAPAEEFTRMFSLRWKDPLFDALLEGYPPIDREEIEFFTFLHLHWRIPWHMKKGNRPKKIMLLTELFSRLLRNGTSS
jgi:aminoglycoside phosphotransferase (APT) family kinase protein